MQPEPPGAFTCAHCEELYTVTLRCTHLPVWEAATCCCCCDCGADRHLRGEMVWFPWRWSAEQQEEGR